MVFEWLGTVTCIVASNAREGQIHLLQCVLMSWSHGVAAQYAERHASMVRSATVTP